MTERIPLCLLCAAARDQTAAHSCRDWAWVLVEGHYIGGRYEKVPCCCPCREGYLF